MYHETTINLLQEEYNLILLLRKKYRFGEVIIQMHDGLPVRIKKAETFSDLRGDLKQELLILLKINEKEEKKEIK